MRKIETIQVPQGITRLSEWPEFESLLPTDEHCILDKTLPGCGFTYFALTCCSKPVILLTPRLELAYSKAAQHPDALLYRARDEKNTPIDQLNQRVSQYVHTSTKPRIIVTYDSAHHVFDSLRLSGRLDNFLVCVDEAHCIVGDAAYKADVEVRLLQQLQHLRHVLYVSATPYNPSFLDDIEAFNRCVFIKLVWPSPPEYTMTTRMKHPITAFESIIRRYRESGFFELKVENGQVIVALQAVFFLNNVKEIAAVLTKYQLRPNEVNLLVSRDAMDKLPKGFRIGSAPLKGKKHKPMTFCSRRAFEGVDFYHENAASYVFFMPNIQCLALDLRVDLLQIIGRQRLPHAFQHNVILYALNFGFTEGERQQWEAELARKEEQTKKVMEIYTTLPHDQRDTIINLVANQSTPIDYLTILKNENAPSMLVENSLTRSADRRALEIRGLPYEKALRMIPADSVGDFIDDFYGATSFVRRMELLVKFYATNPTEASLISPYLPQPYQTYYEKVGPETIKACKYQEKKIKAAIQTSGQREEAARQVKALLPPGSYSRAQVKKVLQGVYDAVGLKKKAKSTDLPTFIDGATEKRVYVDGKRVWGWVVP